MCSFANAFIAGDLSTSSFKSRTIAVLDHCLRLKGSVVTAKKLSSAENSRRRKRPSFRVVELGDATGCSMVVADEAAINRFS